MISIVTPSYNRAYILPMLKSSLDAQKGSSDFEWIIVDDGSDDETEKLAAVWKEQRLPYCIRYIRQENQGKHIAFNTAVQNVRGEWIICVDSDDRLTEKAVASMNEDVGNIPYDCVGIVYPKLLAGFHNETEWAGLDGKKIDIMDLKAVYDIPESAILMRKNKIRDLQFPKIAGEKFIPEGWLYQKLIERGKFWARNKALYLAEYQQDGLTRNVWKLWAENSTGVLMVMREKYKRLKKYPARIRVIEKVKCVINATTICIASDKKILDNVPSKVLGMILYVPSVFFYNRRFR